MYKLKKIDKVMMNKIIILGAVTILNISVSLAQTKRNITIKKIHSEYKIDGVIDDEIWKNAAVADDFFQFEPYNGKKPSQKTEIKITYDNNAIYFGATMYDTASDSIYKELGKRDDGGNLNADLFTVLINPYNDGVNVVEFMVSASGVQTDLKHTGERTDINWNAVWESKVRITNFGWVAEYRIPFSALRFPSKNNEKWGVHFFRHIKRYKEWDTWNYVDVDIKGFITQTGEMSGIKNIDPPLRLSFTPYISTYIEKSSDNEWGNNFNGGMDLKYGINESFTLDMTLIPDFGQVQSDDEVLNLSPFEVHYDEKRPFFTEGTELFNKGGIFYSRRIGGTPTGFDNVNDELNDNEEVEKNPIETKMINASKISGRTSTGLGIGFFNAMTSASYATIIDTITAEKRKIQTQGFSNYNMLVLDQSLQNNSYISLVNTSVLHVDEHYTANVSGTEFSLNNKENSYNIFARGVVNQKYTNEKEFGHSYFLSFEKTQGRFLFDLSHNVESDTYDPNDMGFLRNNNEFTNELELNYNINNPFWKVLNWRNEISFEHSMLYKPRKFTEFTIQFFSSTTFKKKQIHLGFFGMYKPIEEHDYFEPRVDGWMYKKPAGIYLHTYLSSDYRKKLAINLGLSSYKAITNNLKTYSLNFSPRFRANDKLMLIHSIRYDRKFNDYGYVADDINSINETVITFGKRNGQTLVNTFEGSYIFNNKMSLSLRVRHYWSIVEYEDFYHLNENGDLSESIGYDTYASEMDINYNAFTIDMNYIWNFAPGSELSIVWKNSINTSESYIINNYFNNFDNIHLGSISIVS
nr:DUF5916 domain-containing protein [Bacteroidales bacterium]